MGTNARALFVAAGDCICEPMPSWSIAVCLTSRHRMRCSTRFMNFPQKRCFTYWAVVIAKLKSCRILPGIFLGMDRQAGGGCRLFVTGCTTTSPLPTNRPVATAPLMTPFWTKEAYAGIHPSRHHFLPVHGDSRSLRDRLSRRYPSASRASHGFQRLVRGLSRRPMAHVRRTQQLAPSGKDSDGSWPGCGGRGADHHLWEARFGEIRHLDLRGLPLALILLAGTALQLLIRNFLDVMRQGAFEELCRHCRSPGSMHRIDPHE